MLSSLNEIEKDCFAYGDVEIWYMRPDWFPKGISGESPDPHNLQETHVLIGKVSERRLEAIFWMMQGECWSPNGEAMEFLKEKGLEHTSMSVGDAVRIGEKVFVVNTMGWREI